jgi:hypothetical protein
MGELEVRQFLMFLVETKKATPASRKMHVAAIKFLYTITLRRPEVVAAIPWPKVAHGVPAVDHHLTIRDRDWNSGQIGALPRRVGGDDGNEATCVLHRGA